MPVLAFTKMHGLGNDFIVVDLRAIHREAPPSCWFDETSLISILCDRRRGIGADGVLAIFDPSTAARAQGAVARLRIRNADGSEAEMCGNGLRCVARYLAHSQRGGVNDGSKLLIETAAGVLSCTLLAAGEVEIAMGAPRWNFVQRPLKLEDKVLSLTAISMGNPHAVMFCDDGAGPAALRVFAERYGPILERHPLFPERTNVEFVHVATPEHYNVVVWERGCGLTQACGTGACAAVVAACLTGRAAPGAWLTVELPGGPLRIRIACDYSQVYLRGPAVSVYTGKLLLNPCA